MGRPLQAAVLVASMAGIAHAKPATRKFKVETKPDKATVYIDDVGNGVACEETPCEIDVPLGEHTLIFQKKGFEPEFMLVDATKGKKPVVVSSKLKSAIGVLRVDAPKGATVKVNDEPKGKVGSAPLEIEVPADTMSVVITHNGKTQTELVEVEAGAQLEIEFKPDNTSVGSVDDDDGGDGDDSDGGDDGDDGDIPDGPPDDGEQPEVPAPALREPRFEGGLAMDVGFRRFKFSDGSGPFNNSGEAVLGPAIEVWPGRLLGVAPLRGLSLFAKVQFGVSPQQVTRETNGQVTDVGASTVTGAIEVSLRQKFVIGGGFGIEASAGFNRDQLQFNADNQTALDMVPAADYRSLRFGARLSYVATFEPYVGGEYRSVMSGGELATRADQATTSGFAVRAGVKTSFGNIGVRGEFVYSKYTWAFASTGAMPFPRGADDTLMWLGFFAGYGF